MRFKRFLLLVAGLFLLMKTHGQQINWVKRYGRLKVSNGKILNQANAPLQLRGVSLSWSIWEGEKYYNANVVDWLCKDFKINLLRVSMAVQPAGGYLEQPQAQEKRVIAVIDAAIKNNIYVIIDWHDHHADDHVILAGLFFEKIAKRYASKANLIYEIFNEPEEITWETVKQYAAQIIPRIRKYAKENLIVVGTPHWDQDIDVAAKESIMGYTNIAYSFHFYASAPIHQQWLRERANHAIAANLPVFVTEWGVGEADGNGRFDVSKTNIWLNWLERNQLSWVNWNITDKNETTAILKSGAAVNGKWTNDMLTPAGLYIRNVLRAYNE